MMVHHSETLMLDIPTTNCLRGLSILIIVIFHVILYYGISPFFNLPGSVAVAVFLFLSGYGVNESWKKHGMKHFWLKKFRRIILPYYILLLVKSVVTGQFQWQDMLLDMTFIHSSYWFIEYIVRCYFVFWVARKFFPRKSYTVFIIFGLLSLNLFMQLEAEQSFSFFAGMLVSDNIEKIHHFDQKKLSRIFLCSFAIGLFFYLFKAIPVIHQYKGTLPYHYILLFIKLPLAICCILLPYYFTQLSHSGILHKVGKCSLELYLVHMAFLPYLSQGLKGMLWFTLLTALFTIIFYLLDTRVIPKLVPISDHSAS